MFTARLYNDQFSSRIFVYQDSCCCKCFGTADWHGYEASSEFVGIASCSKMDNGFELSAVSVVIVSFEHPRDFRMLRMHTMFSSWLQESSYIFHVTTSFAKQFHYPSVILRLGDVKIAASKSRKGLHSRASSGQRLGERILRERDAIFVGNSGSVSNASESWQKPNSHLG